MKPNSWRPSALVLAVASLAAPATAAPQANPEPTEYRLPPPEVVEIVDAAPTPTLSISPEGVHYLRIDPEPMPTIADLSRRMLRLAGMRIDPAANGRYRTSFNKGLGLYINTRVKGTAIPVPEGGRLADVSWSPSSNYFVYSVVTEKGTQLWGAGLESPARMLTDRLNTVTGFVSWLPDGTRLLCRLVPEDRGPEPPAPMVPKGPNVQATAGSTSPLRTYQDLLASPYDEALFDYYATAQLAILALTHENVVEIGEPAIYRDIEPAPDGSKVLLTTVHRPYSYLMPWSSFPHVIRVHDLDGGAEHVVAEVPLGDDIPLHGVRMGPRSVGWKAGERATLVWTEALDGGDPKRDVPHRDRWMAHEHPFSGEPRELLRVEHRAWGLSWFEDKSLVLSTEYDRDRRWLRTLLHDLDEADSEPRTLEDRSIRDRYGNPGRVVTMLDWKGRRVVRLDGPWIYRTGEGASPAGLRPFVDRQNIETLASERLWECEEDQYETVVKVVETVEDYAPAVITRRETPTQPPNYKFRQLHFQKEFPMTAFNDPTPQIRKIKKELVKYERDDGVLLSATLYLPADYVEGTRLPLIVWAYPIEFNDAATAGQVGTSPHRFIRIRGYSHLNLLTQGYAIMDGATMPIIGDPETMNDTFVKQLVGSAKAAIDKAVEMGVADPDRVAVGGHSYGAFMTANLLANCDLFKAGVARSGAYNRTLTPFGFQAERRTFWEAPESYFKISPFMHADAINEPLLLIHGEADNNSGTFPLQSERMFQAIKGHGGTARLVMLPKESHGYRARESVMHVLAETIDWLDEHVKNAGGE